MQRSNSKKTDIKPKSLLRPDDNAIVETKIEVFEFNSDSVKEYTLTNTQVNTLKLPQLLSKDKIVWINVDGITQLDTIEHLCKAFNIHTLVTEDILNTAQRPKIENYNTYIYIVSKMMYCLNENIINEQLSIILGDGYVISFGEIEGDIFNTLRERIRKDGGHIRKSGADYLAYSLLDTVVDSYFNVLESLGNKIDDLEEILFSNPTTESLQQMRVIKKQLLYMQHFVWPLREVAAWMQRDSSSLIQSSTQVYVRDVYDHVIQVIDTIETFRELLSGLMDIYLSSISNKMNEIMKVLTIISTIFIPLTFIAGIYGMNFKYMPELEWKWGYELIIGIMLVIAISMLAYFKRKKWF